MKGDDTSLRRHNYELVFADLPVVAQAILVGALTFWFVLVALVLLDL